MLQLPAAEARLRVEHALMVGTHRTLTGQTREPQLPATPAAQAMRIRGQRHERTSSLDPTGRANARKRGGGSPARRPWRWTDHRPDWPCQTTCPDQL